MQTRSSPNLQTLHNLANEARIPDFENLSKPALFQKLKEKFDFERVQRIENRRSRVNDSLQSKKRAADEVATTSSSSSVEGDEPKKKKSNRVSNKLDPIMFTPIRKTKAFKFTRSNGVVVAFNVDTLVEYMVATGDFSDPETRIPFSDTELAGIDAMAIKLKLAKPSVLDLKNNPQAFADFKFKRDALLGLERCAGEVITDILNVIETYDPDEAQMRIVLRELPTFADYFQQLRAADAEFASHCASHWKSFLEGPPNRPYEDDYGLIELTCTFIAACEVGVTQFFTSGAFIGF